MNNINIKLLKTHPDAVLPSANNKELGTGDTGFDLIAVEDVKIPKGGSNIISVGLQLADMTPGYWMRIEPRSGLGFKKSLQPHLGIYPLIQSTFTFSDTITDTSRGDKGFGSSDKNFTSSTG